MSFIPISLPKFCPEKRTNVKKLPVDVEFWFPYYLRIINHPHWLAPGSPPPLPPQFDDSFLWEAASSTGSKISCSVRPTAWTMSRASTLGSRHAPVEAAFFSLKEKYGDWEREGGREGCLKINYLYIFPKFFDLALGCFVIGFFFGNELFELKKLKGIFLQVIKTKIHFFKIYH